MRRKKRNANCRCGSRCCRKTLRQVRRADVEDKDGKLHPRVSLNPKQRRKKRSNQNKKLSSFENFEEAPPASNPDVAPVDDETQKEKRQLQMWQQMLQEDAETSEKGELLAMQYLLEDESRVVKLCMQDKHTSHIMQDFIQNFKVANTMRLLGALKGHVLTLVKDLHGNFVISQAIHFLSDQMLDDIVEELIGHAVDLVQLNYACRILVRIIDHAASMDSLKNHPRKALMDELLNYDRLSDLCKHKYAHHVLQAMLKTENEANVPEEYRHKIAKALAENLMDFCNNRNASFLVENALKTCSERDKNSLAESLTYKEDYVITLAGNHFGCFVLLQVLKLGGPYAERALQYIKMNSDKLRESKTGRGLLLKLEQNPADEPEREPEEDDSQD